MEKVKLADRKVKTDEGTVKIEYWITKTDCDESNIMCRGEFGIEVVDTNEKSRKCTVANINNMFVFEDEAKAFAFRMAEGDVFAVHLLDVVDDMLTEQKIKYIDKFCSVSNVE